MLLLRLISVAIQTDCGGRIHHGLEFCLKLVNSVLFVCDFDAQELPLRCIDDDTAAPLERGDVRGDFLVDAVVECSG